jgi:hypothetical protein
MSLPRAQRPRAEAAETAEAPHVPADNLLAAIHVVSNRISRAFYADIEARHGISLPEWRVMLTLTRHPGMAAQAHRQIASAIRGRIYVSSRTSSPESGVLASGEGSIYGHSAGKPERRW